MNKQLLKFGRNENSKTNACMSKMTDALPRVQAISTTWRTNILN